MDQETFAYMHYQHLEVKSFIHALYITGHENNTTIFNKDVYQPCPYHMTKLTIGNFARELSISLFLDKDCMFFIMLRQWHNRHNILYKCNKIPVDYTITHTGKGGIKVDFLILIPLHIQQDGKLEKPSTLEFKSCSKLQHRKKLHSGNL